ncbi:MAG TPA: PDZ domain-containing protein, partial [Mizugakiibacter sp.]
VDHGGVTRGWIGAEFGRVPIAADSSLPAAPHGAEVMDVYAGGPAARAGLQRGDVLLRLGEHDILDPSDLRNREAALKPGTSVTLSGLRDGTPFRAALVLAQRPRYSSLGEG